MKPTKLAVAFYIEDDGKFTAVKRNDDDQSFPGVWGLPAGSLQNSEDFEAAVRRAAKTKLGIDVGSMRFEGEMEIEREKYFTRLREYRIIDFSGVPTLQNGNEYYAELTWQSDPEIFREPAKQGALCSRIFLKNRAKW